MATFVPDASPTTPAAGTGTFVPDAPVAPTGQFVPDEKQSPLTKTTSWFHDSFINPESWEAAKQGLQKPVPAQISKRMTIPEVSGITPEDRTEFATFMGRIGLPQFAGLPIEAIPAIHNRILKPLADFATSQIGVATGVVSSGPKFLAQGVQAIYAGIMGKQAVENLPETVRTVLDPKQSAQNKWDSAAGEALALSIPMAVAVHGIDISKAATPADAVKTVMDQTGKTADQVAADMQEGATAQATKTEYQTELSRLQQASAKARGEPVDEGNVLVKTFYDVPEATAAEEEAYQNSIKAAAVKLPDGTIKEGPEHDAIAPEGAGKDGFTTTQGPFVDRKEGMEIAKDAGQVPADTKATELHASMIEPPEPFAKGQQIEYYSPVTRTQFKGTVTGIDGKWISITNEDGAPVVQEAKNVWPLGKERSAELVDIGKRPSPEEQAERNKVVENDLRAQTAQRPGQRVAVDDTEAINKAAERQGTGPTYGIANRVNEERAAAGYIDPVEPGEGMSPEALVQRGRDDLNAGADPESVFVKFAKDKRVGSRDIGIVRAYGEKLAKTADAAADKYGTDSSQYQQAAKADSDWAQRIQVLKGVPSEALRAMQGETEIDTGTFHGLRRAFQASSGRDFTAEETQQAKQVAAKVKRVAAESDAATQEWSDTISKGKPNDAYPKSLVNRLISSLDKEASAALERITARRAKGQAFAGGINPEELDDYVIYGASKIAKGVLEKGRWAAEMVKELGDYIKPHLEDIWQKARAEVNKRLTDSIPTDARAAVVDQIKGTDVAAVWKRAKLYIDQGLKDPAEVISKVATDSGLSFKETLEKLSATKGTRRISDEMWGKMSERRTVVMQAKRWLEATKDPKLIRYAKAVPDFFFNVAIMGHGTVWSVTHGGVNYFIPQNWNAWVPNFFKSFKLMGLLDNGAYHEKMMQNLMHSPDYNLARRSGLKIDPYRFTDDYQNSWIRASFGRFGLMGNRGFDGLKLARKGLWDNFWNDLPDSQKTPAAARVLSAQVNHLTGSVDLRLPGWLSTTARTTFFAPTLEASRWSWLYGDPAKATKTFLSWKDAGMEERTAAIREVKQKATWAGVYLTSLAANQGFLTATGSDEKINFTDPTKSDFLAFKVAGHKIGFFTPVIGTVRFLAEVAMQVMPELQPARMQHNKDAQAAIASDSFSYLRGKLSPFAGTVADLATRTDYARRPLPFGGKPVPAYIRRQGEGAYTWPQYLATKAPIPFAEAVHEIWLPMGMDESMAHHWLLGLGAGMMMGTTGVRMSEDTAKPKPQPLPEIPTR